MRLAIAVVLTIVFSSIFAEQIAPYDPIETDLINQLTSPNPEHLFGTDYLGRDVFSRILYGGRNTFWLTGIATIVTVFISSIIVAVSTIFLPKTDILFRILLDAMLSVPQLLVALMLMTLFGQGRTSITIALAVTQVASFTYVIRGAILQVRNSLFVDASICLGATRIQIFKWHIIPSIFPIVITQTTTLFNYHLINITTLSFLGLTNTQTELNWGNLLSEGKPAFRIAPWVAIIPGILITTTIYTINYLADKFNQNKF